MKGIRRKEKAITNIDEMKQIIQQAEHVTLGMCKDNIPYLVTVSHGYDPERNYLFFHCANEGKKIDILKENNIVWGQAMIDKGYVQGKCDHLYATTQFKGRVVFLEDFEQKKTALLNMIHKLDNQPERVIQEQITTQSVNRVTIAQVEIEFMTGKQAKQVTISL
jgi:hypothetical protein